MAQEPNIELGIEDLPRPRPHPAPPRRWSPARPGELHGPGDVPWGGAFGTPGPDTGYALKLVHDAPLAVAAGEDRHDAETAVAAVAAARASHFGRAPTPEDVALAAIILGYDREAAPDSVFSQLALDRPRWVANLSHAPQRAGRLVASVPLDVLVAPADEVRRRSGAGERLLAL